MADRVGLVLCISCFVVSLAAAVSPAAADFADGLEAYDGGRYEDALAEWRPLAESGHADAVVAIAGLYMAGLGVARDPVEAARWYKRAADCGHPVGQLNIGDMYARGIGVDRDLVAAHLYLTLAGEQGRDWARLRLEAVEAQMDADQKHDAAVRRRNFELASCARPLD